MEISPVNRPARGKAASEDRLPPNKAYFPFLFLSLVYPIGSRQPGPGQGREGLHQSAIGLASQSLVQRPAASHREPVRNADSWGPDGWVRTCNQPDSWLMLVLREVLEPPIQKAASGGIAGGTGCPWSAWVRASQVAGGAEPCRCYLPDWCRLDPAETEMACGSGLHPPFQWGFFIKWTLQALVQDD